MKLAETNHPPRGLTPNVTSCYAHSQSLLGSRHGLLEPIPSREEHANGHVARNVRLSLMVVDLVEPYVEWLPRTTRQVLIRL